MNMDDYLYDRRFADVIARSCSHYDTHARDLGNESDFAQVWLVVLDMFKKGSYWCDIPYRSLLPKGINGLLVASRALSVDREVSMGVRMQRDIQKIGEAAGIAAALSAAQGLEPRQLPIQQLQQKLLERGVLKQPDLTRSTTANLMLQKGPLGGKPLTPEYVRGLQGEEAVHLAEHLASYMGTEEEGAAVWWMTLLGHPAEAPLLALLNGAGEHEVRRTAALALGLLGSKQAIPHLIHMLRIREDNRGPLARSLPKWIAAVVVLRLLGCRVVLGDMVMALEENHSAGINTFLLQFLYQLSGGLGVQERTDLTDRLKRWVSRTDIGEGYMTPKENAVISIRWNIVLWIGRILVKNGDESGIEICKPYLDDPRIFVRLAAAEALREMERLLVGGQQEGGMVR
ncbi:FAD dependent oxidoreductase [compost metagenome]